MSEVKVFYTYVLVKDSFAKRESRITNHVTEYLNPKTGEWERSLYEHAWIFKHHHDQALADKDKRIKQLEKGLREAHSAMVKVEKFGYGVNIEKDLVITNTQDLMIKAANGLAEALKEKG